MAQSSSFWFAHIYFAKYIKYETAEFQKEMYELVDKPEHELVEALGFRGCTKSTIFTLIAPIFWMVAQDVQYEIFIGDTFPQAKQYLYNIKTELETNELLIADFGPFKPETKEDNDEWQKTSIVIPKYNTRMSAHSSGQNIRGLRHLDIRPQRVVCDDIENLKSVRKKENRDKTYNWLKTDVFNVGDRGTRYFVLGNLLHSDGLMKRLENEIKSGKLTGKMVAYPIADKKGNPLWPGKFENKAALEAERRRVNNEKTWKRESLLQIVPEDGQVIKEEWIKRYQYIAKEFVPGAVGCGVDLAISQKATADYTAMIPGTAGMLNERPKIYVSNGIVHKRMGMHDTVAEAKLMQSKSPMMQFFVEAVGYQKAAIETMEREWVNVQGVQPMGDKRARLEVVAKYIQDGTIEFEDGEACDALIDELLGFGVEEHDDQVDAFVYLILGLIRGSLQTTEVMWL